MRCAIYLLMTAVFLNADQAVKSQETQPESVSALIDQLKTGGEHSRGLAAHLLGSWGQDVERSLSENLGGQFDGELNRIDIELRQIDSELSAMGARLADTGNAAAQADLESRKNELDESKRQLEAERERALLSLAAARAQVISSVAKLLGNDPQDVNQAEDYLKGLQTPEPLIASIRLFKSAVEALAERRAGGTRDSSAQVRAESAFSLGLLVSHDIFFGENKADHDLIQTTAESLVGALDDGAQGVRLRAAWACGQFPAGMTVNLRSEQKTSLISALLDACDDSDAQVRVHAAAAVERLLN